MEQNFTDYLKGQIQSSGPLSIAEYMQACLADPEHGYYRVQDPIGADGDFVTAPEVSQVFGELVGVWGVSCWSYMNQPSPFHFIELGPGKGTMMNDMLRAARVIPDFLKSAHVHMTETSPTLINKQRAALAYHSVNCEWHGDPEMIEAGPAIIVANEFLDALPIHQFVYKQGQWYERLVGLNSEGELTFLVSLKPYANQSAIPAPASPPAEGDMIEIRPAVKEIVRMLSERAKQAPVVSLFIDYGHIQTSIGDTFQAVKNHKFHPPLENPGEADLTSHVDFGDLKAEAEAKGLKTFGPITQSQFLQGLGLKERVVQLANGLSKEKQKDLADSISRLAAPDQMGNLFKVLVITGGTDFTPPPFGELSDLE